MTVNTRIIQSAELILAERIYSDFSSDPNLASSVRLYSLSTNLLNRFVDSIAFRSDIPMLHCLVVEMASGKQRGIEIFAEVPAAREIIEFTRDTTKDGYQKSEKKFGRLERLTDSEKIREILSKHPESFYESGHYFLKDNKGHDGRLFRFSADCEELYGNLDADFCRCAYTIWETYCSLLGDVLTHTPDFQDHLECHDDQIIMTGLSVKAYQYLVDGMHQLMPVVQTQSKNLSAAAAGLSELMSQYIDTDVHSFAEDVYQFRSRQAKCLTQFHDDLERFSTQKRLALLDISPNGFRNYPLPILNA